MWTLLETGANDSEEKNMFNFMQCKPSLKERKKERHASIFKRSSLLAVSDCFVSTFHREHGTKNMHFDLSVTEIVFEDLIKKERGMKKTQNDLMGKTECLL